MEGKRHVEEPAMATQQESFITSSSKELKRHSETSVDFSSKTGSFTSISVSIIRSTSGGRKWRDVGLFLRMELAYLGRWW